MIWTTAKSTEVSSRHRPPARAGRAGSSACRRPMPPGPRPVTPRTGPRRRPARRSTAPARRGRPRAPRRSRPGGPRGPRARPRPAAGPGVIPAATSSASESWRWEVDGGWTTIVWTLPSEAVSSVRVSASMTARPASRPPATSTASIPPATPGPELAHGDGVLRVARQARVEDAVHAVLTFEPGGECRRGPRVALHPDGQRQDAAQHEERVERADRRPRVDLDPLDLARRARRGRPRRRR